MGWGFQTPGVGCLCSCKVIRKRMGAGKKWEHSVDLIEYFAPNSVQKKAATPKAPAWSTIHHLNVQMPTLKTRAEDYSSAVPVIAVLQTCTELSLNLKAYSLQPNKHQAVHLWVSFHPLAAIALYSMVSIISWAASEDPSSSCCRLALMYTIISACSLCKHAAIRIASGSEHVKIIWGFPFWNRRLT